MDNIITHNPGSESFYDSNKTSTTLEDFLTESKCLLQSQKEAETQNGDNSFCGRIWDNIYCWPPTPAGYTISFPCSQVINQHYPASWNGNAYRICSPNGTWEWGNWTNYTECLEYFDEEEEDTGSEGTEFISIVNIVKYILFIGSIASLISLSISLFIFWYFRSLKCDRIKLHVHLMVALALRFILLIVVAEPFIFNRASNYRNVDWTCKLVLSFLMYVTVSSVNWMFIQGHYLHSRLTTNVFHRGTSLRVYYATGWILPLFLIITWASVMETFHPIHCWENYSKLDYIWILVGPMLLALIVNLLFLINIMRILLTKIQLASVSTDSAQIKRAVKATLVLFPLLGINNLFFVYNPGGSFEHVYLVANTILQSSQGFLVSLLYCFITKDVREAISREYRRFRVVQNLTRTRAGPTIRRTCASLIPPIEMATITTGKTTPDRSRESNGKEMPESKINVSPSPLEDPMSTSIV